ncbi:DUF4149 domain-containing protein [Helicobacter sp. MIT 14-3879]|uniref:DUF4149 domain-containing protein n=1 Tax=Helicobacter sp. MIT 14-3879 TaxID=2040649 RepID=UPI000E1E6B40|nr:DUF4149 domain-containing protein [Helicobacter sp. MIT 14-3879]RDU62446.1 DUF4149 domain-containing protein [Helicobacter sp. MIT 14-3879]
MNIFFSKNFINTIKAIYIWLLGLSIGIIFSSGAFIASVLFYAKDFGIELEKFEAGILMTEIFSRINIFLLIIAFIITFYEILSLKLESGYKAQKSILFISSLISVICIFLFSLYYTPYIIEQQKIGEIAINTNQFLSMHKQSEWVFKILFFTLSFNLIYRILKK